MKLLWIGNGPIQKVCNLEKTSITGDIGWISSILDCLLVNNNFQIIYVFPQEKSNVILRGGEGLFRYYGIYQREKRPWKRNRDFTTQLEEILKIEMPELVHIWGTEYAHSLDCFAALQNKGMDKRVVIHIQGLISVYAENYFAGLPNRICRKYSFWDVFRCSNIEKERKRYQLRGKNEIELLRQVSWVMGRTDWDKSHVLNINPDITYFTCSESMKKVFFQYSWKYDECEKQSICVSQGNYPIKGIHYLIKAIGIVSKSIPDVKVYVAGENILHSGKKRIREKAYAKYIRRLLKKYQVEKNFSFIGYQTSDEMAKLYVKANVFVLPSEIENSPNSLAEAMIVGTPCIASDVGGVSSMVEHKKNGFLYPHNDPVVLAMYISEMICSKELCEELSLNARKKARSNYDADRNKDVLINIYKSILDYL